MSINIYDRKDRKDRRGGGYAKRKFTIEVIDGYFNKTI